MYVVRQISMNVCVFSWRITESLKGKSTMVYALRACFTKMTALSESVHLFRRNAYLLWMWAIFVEKQTTIFQNKHIAFSSKCNQGQNPRSALDCQGTMAIFGFHTLQWGNVGKPRLAILWGWSSVCGPSVIRLEVKSRIDKGFGMFVSVN